MATNKVKVMFLSGSPTNSFREVRTMTIKEAIELRNKGIVTILEKQESIDSSTIGEHK